MSKTDSLFQDFHFATSEDWAKAAAAEINGADPFKKLQWKIGENLQFKAYYSSEDLKNNLPHSGFVIQVTDRPDARFWYNMPSITVTSEKQANELAIEHLRSEADGILFEVNKEIDFSLLLQGIEWEHCPVSFYITDKTALLRLTEFISKSKFDTAKISGVIFSSFPNLKPESGQLRSSGIYIDSSDPVKEVADALLKGVEAVSSGIEQNKKADIFKSIAFNMPVGTNLLHDIAKLKALRFLWAQVAHSYGYTDYKINELFLHGRSERWINDHFQPHGNMLKSTMAAIAMICGGCNAVTVEPEDPSNSTMRRIARNTSFILREESHFGKVSDPFGGAYVIEILVDSIAKEAWTHFQKAWEQKELVTQNA